MNNKIVKKYEGTEFWDGLWRQIEKNAKGLSVSQVLKAFREISDEMYDAGIDDVYDEIIKSGNIQSANFDITWLTLLAVKLSKLKKLVL